MKTLLACGVAAAALVGLAPAIAQSGQQTDASPKAVKVNKVHSRAEVQAKVAEHFARLDTNRDGAITRAEADAAREQFRTRIVERLGERRAQSFERLDANNDGAISRSEWDAAGAQRAERIEIRRKAGEDGGHKMRGAHRMHVMGMIGGRMFDLADADKDGRVTLQEAQALALQHFDMADANRDGQITPDERRQMHHRMMIERRPG